MPHLLSLTYDAPTRPPAEFPFTVPIVQSLTALDLSADVTFLVGENGSGKSTLLEALACAGSLHDTSNVGVKKKQS